MNNYLLQLLKEIKTIIIPGLGAITLTNEATGEMMFMPYLKFDDGNLAAHISKKEGMDLNDAKNLIAKFVREVTAELDKGNSYDMYQFGRFQKVDGEITFTQWTAGSTSEPVAEKPVADTHITQTPEIVPEDEAEPVHTPVVPEPVIVEIPEPVNEPEPTPEPPIEEAPVEPVAPLIPDPIKEEPLPPVPPVEKPAPEVKKPVEAPKATTLSPKERVAQQDAQKKTAAPKAKAKMSVLSYILWGIVVLILGAATYVAVNFNSLKQDFPLLADLAGESDTDFSEAKKAKEEMKKMIAEDEDTTAEETPVEDVTTIEETPAPQPEPAPQPAEQPKPAPQPKPTPQPKPAAQPKPAKTAVSTPKPSKPVAYSGGTSNAAIGSPDASRPYHVVGGSFSSEANAKRFARELIAQGKSSVIVGETGGMYRVSIESFATKEQAMQALPGLKSVAANAWVFKWP